MIEGNVSGSDILKESRKWKEFEENTLKIIKNYRNARKHEEESCESLKNQITHLNHTKCDMTQMLKLDMYNKFIASNDIFKLGKSTDDITDCCNDIERILLMCNTLEQKCKNHLEHFNTELTPKKIKNEDALKLENSEFLTLKECIKNHDILISTEIENRCSELNSLKDLERETSTTLQILLSNHEKLENDIPEIDKNIERIQQTTLETEMNQKGCNDNEFDGINETISNSNNRFENTILDMDKSKEALEDHSCAVKNLFKQNLSLEYSAECFENKSLDLEKLNEKEEMQYLENISILQNDNKIFSEELRDNEDVVLKEKELQKVDISNMELSNSDLRNIQGTITALQQDVDLLGEDKMNLIASNNQEVESANVLSQNIRKSNDDIQHLKLKNDDLESRILNFTMAHKASIKKLREKIDNTKADTDVKKDTIEKEKLEHKVNLEKSEFKLITYSNEEQFKLENEIIYTRKSDVNHNEDIKQLSIELESNTLECDILSRKIKTALDLQAFVKEELRPKPLTFNTIVPGRKRRINETSDSSFDGNIPFHRRIIMKKKIKKVKLPGSQMT